MIIDCIPYYKEASILELRLYELDPVVDYFVVVEADRTHAGALKPSYFPNELRKRWAHKLFVYTARLPEGDGLVWTWRREMMQRNAIKDALHAFGAQPDDMILISDCDEIPRRSFVQSLWQAPDDAVVIAHQRLSYYTFNHVARDAVWNGTRATKYANLVALGADGVRYAGQERGGFPRLIGIRDAGWHLSYFGGPEYVQDKIQNFLHQEFNTPEHTDPATIARRIDAAEDVYGRPEQRFMVDWAYDLPQAVYERPANWKQHFYEPYAPILTETWTSGDQAMVLAYMAAQVEAEGVCMEIGSWQGLSTVALAHGLNGRELVAIDTWRGNESEADHPTIAAAQDRDVYAEFLQTIRAFGLKNVVPMRMDWREALAQDTRPVAFAYLDAGHDEETVTTQIDALIPRCVHGTILAGDDYYTTGVRLGIRRLTGVETDGRMWWWRYGG